MSKIAINKKKIKLSLIIKKLILVSLIFILLIYFSLFLINYFKSNILINYVESLSAKYQYTFTEIEINGLNNISKKEINKYTEEYFNKSIFLIPIYEISKKINKNKWIESLSIKSNYKNKITINIKEVVPLGIYYNEIDYLLIDNLGNIIDYAKKEKLYDYILLRGNNANIYAFKFMQSIPNSLKLIIKEAHYINNRRWDIFTKESLRIRLPEKEYIEAMNTLLDIYYELQSSNISDIEYIDLRIREKVIIKYHKLNND